MALSTPTVSSILILTTDAGSGHRSAATALEAAFESRYGDAVRVTICNPWRHASAPALLQHYEQFYLRELQHAPWLYQFSYAASELPIIDQALASTARRFSARAIANVLAEHPADLVISVYPHFTATVAAICGRTATRPKLMTVVTDLGAVHRVWFNPGDDCCVVPTALARQQALHCGMDPRRVALTGLPVHTSFGAPTDDPRALRQRLGWYPELRTLLLMGGGAGVGDLAALAHAIDAAELPIQLVVVAGANAALAERLRAMPWRIPVQVYNYVPLADLMRAADMVATKAGGLTISEALAAGKPLLIHSCPPGQEAGNLQYIESIGAGYWTPTPEALVAQVRRWLAHPAALGRAAAASARHGQPNAAHQIAGLAWEVLSSTPVARPDVRPALVPRLATGRGWWVPSRMRHNRSESMAVGIQ